LKPGHPSHKDFHEKNSRGKNSNKVLLVYITPETIANAGKFCDAYGFHQVYLVIGNDVDATKSTRGQLIEQMDISPPRCETEFSGFIQNSVLLSWTASRQELTDTSYDTGYTYPSQIKDPPKHYIYIGASTSRNSNNCERSYKISEENLRNFDRYDQ
jgi:hypothetical protein